MLGRAAVAMWWDVAPELKAEWEDWHSHEHMLEVKDLATMTGGAYLERLNNPTPWSRKMMPLHRNMVRSLCRVRASQGRRRLSRKFAAAMRAPTGRCSSAGTISTPCAPPRESIDCPARFEDSIASHSP